jgi:diaminopimelate decarboxylase
VSLKQRALRTTKQLIRSAVTPMAQRLATRAPALPPAQWGLEVTSDGQLTVDGLSLHALRERWGSPLHIVRADKLRENVRAFQEVGGDACEVYYSYKTNPIPGMLKLLHAQGVGAEVISPYELWLAFALGVDPERVVYNGPAKSDESIALAIEKDIKLLNVNHREEVARVVRFAREKGKRPRVGVRVGTSAGWSAQFGTSIASGEAWETVKELVESKAVRFVALHSHVGGAIKSTGQLQVLVDEVLAFADRIRGELGQTVEVLDFGGSLATPTVRWLSAAEKRASSALNLELAPPAPEDTLSIRDYVQAIKDRVLAHAAAQGIQAPRIYFEPGRAMTGNTQLLVAGVITVKEAPTAPHFAIMDAGINLAECMRAEYHRLFPANRMNEEKSEIYRLAGPICSPGDVISSAFAAPRLAPGDSVAVMDSGAYFVPFSTSFSFPQPAVVLVDGGKVSLLKKAQTFDDMVRLDSPEG